MKQFNLSFLLLFFSYHLIAQAPATTAAGYYFATSPNYSLVNMAGATTVIGPGLENVATITFDMGFNFNFAGTDYNRFSVGSSGVMGLGNIPVSPVFYEPRNPILEPFYVYPIFSPWSDALTTAANGGVSYKILTVNNLKKLVIEWRVKASTDGSTLNYNKTFQVWLWEGSNYIQYVYGNSPAMDENSFIAIAKSIPDYKLVSSSTHTITQNSNNVWPGAGRTYIFSPLEIIAAPVPIFISNNGSSVNVNCFGAANGSITLGTISGGDGNYNTSWTGPNGFTASGSSINNLAGGTYNYTITDGSNADPITGSVTISEPAVLAATVSSSQACAGSNNGGITISNTTGGSGNYEFSINNGTWQSFGSFSGLSAGTYTVQMRDAVTTSCTKSLGTQTITELTLTASVSSANSCAGTNNGSISISNTSGGSGNYEFSINNGAWQSSNVFSALSAGTYSVQMRDVNFNTCVKGLGNVTVNEYNLNATVSSTPACIGTNNGTISVSNPTGGSGNYEFSLNNGSWQSTSTFNNLPAGVYDVQMRDVSLNSCIRDLGNMPVGEYSLNASVSTSPACQGTNNGSITISNPSGGSGNYEFGLNNGSWQSSPSFNNLSGGSYSVQMRDIALNSCTKNLGAFTVSSSSLSATPTSSPTCPGKTNGSITVSNASGGDGNYEYRINNGSWQSSNVFGGLSAGNYPVSMREANTGTCIKDFGNVHVGTSPNMTLSIFGNVASFCNSLTLTASGTGAVSYTWNSGQTTASIQLGINNADGLYTVTAANSNGCTASASYFYQKQNLLNSYTLLVLKSSNLGENNTVNGSVGNTTTGTGPANTTNINKNSVINGFLKASLIHLTTPVTITNGTFTSAATVSLPAAMMNTAVTAGLPNLTLPDDYNGPAITANINQLTIGKRAKVTLTGNIFGKITIKDAADVTFTASDISIDDLSAGNGAALPPPASGIDYLTINFSSNAIIRIKNTIKLGEKNLVNSFGATFYMSDNNVDAEKITINGRNTTVNANTFMLHGTMSITNSDANNPCVMNGTHVDEIINSSKNVTWTGFDCGSTNGGNQRGGSIFNRGGEVNNSKQASIIVYPNPTKGIFYLQSGLSEKGTFSILNSEGVQVQNWNTMELSKGQPVRFDISQYPSGVYYIKVITENGVYTTKLVKIQ